MKSAFKSAVVLNCTYSDDVIATMMCTIFYTNCYFTVEESLVCSNMSKQLE